MSEKITLEDINTWLMKYDSEEPNLHSAPHITVNKGLYRGNTTDVTDLISLPDDNIPYTIYWKNKPVTEIELPIETGNTVQVRVVTKSYDEYIPIDVYVPVNVQTPTILTIEDLNNYKYAKPSLLPPARAIEGEVNNDIIIDGEGLITPVIARYNIIVNGKITLRNIGNIRDSIFIINNELSIKDMTLSEGETTNYFRFINNGNLILDNMTFDRHAQNLILNNNHLEVKNCEFLMATNTNLPVIHSSTNDYILKNNNFTFTNATGYGICVIRADEFDSDQFLLDNTTNYDCTYVNDETNYHVTGEGVAYCEIDEDIIHFKNLEVEEDV